MLQAALSDASKVCRTSEFPRKCWRSGGGLPSGDGVPEVRFRLFDIWYEMRSVVALTLLTSATCWLLCVVFHGQHTLYMFFFRRALLKVNKCDRMCYDDV